MRIVIIGAGVLGASAAFHLARDGAAVTVIDARLDGRATAAGAGIICPWVSGVEDPAFYRLYVAAGEYYPELIAALEGAETGYRRNGAMLVSSDPRELAVIERTVRQRAVPAMGEITRLGEREAQGLFPGLRDRLGAVHVAGGARVDGRLLTAALLSAAARLGATIMQGRAALVVEAGRVAGVDIGEQRLAADRVIVTAGAWANDVLRDGPLVAPQRGQIVHLRLGVETRDWPVVLPPGNHYIVPFDGGRVVVGATRETGVGFDYRVTLAGQAEVLAEALRIAPGLGGAEIVETRVGFRPVGVEVRPMLGWVRGIHGLAAGNGLGAAGLTIGPYAGRLLADLVTGREALTELAAFDPMRRVATSLAGGEGLR